MKSLCIKALLPVLVIALASPVMWAAEDLSGNADYKAKCAACHGAKGEGKPAMKTVPLSQSASKSDAELTQMIAKGKGKMPAYEGKLSKDQIDSLVKAIKAQK
jgi:mono/diheme cytochrome c family protein